MMKATKFKKALLIMGMGMGLSSVVFSAHAFPSYSDCQDMVVKCAAGDMNACNTVAGLCWKYGL